MGKVYVVATPIGNLSDISARALETLKNVDLIAAEDTRRTLKLLNYFDIKKPIISNFKYNEIGRGKELIDRIIREDINVAVVSDAGTPCISDPGSALVDIALKNNIEVVAIPGPSSVTAALSVSGFSFTEFTFLGFVPRDNKDRKTYFNKILNSGIETFVIFESPNRIIKSLCELQEYLNDCEVFVINDITKFHERFFKGDIASVIDRLSAGEKAGLGEYTVVVHKKAGAGTVRGNNINETESSILSPEAFLMDEMVKNNCTLKEAIEIVANKTGIGKKEIYKASLNLKKILG